jgi:hypothetical protein
MTISKRPLIALLACSGAVAAAAAGLIVLGNPAPGQTPAAKQKVGMALGFRTPVIASPWTRVSTRRD